MKKKAMTINGNPRCVGGTMKHGLLLSAAVAASSALALDFANSDGTGLLSNKANWGGTLPNSSTAATVAVPGTFSTAAGITTGNATLKGDGLTLSLGVYSWAANGYLYCEQAGSRVVLNGGTYTATGDMRVDNGGAGNVHLVLTNGASIVSDGRFNCGWGNGGGSSLTVTGEGSSLVANSTMAGYLGNTSANHLIHVADHGNFATYANRFNIGQGGGSVACTNNEMLVETRGTATFHKGLNIGHANSTTLTGMQAGNNKLIIRSGGKVESGSGINMGSKWHSPSNLVEVTDGGSLVVDGADCNVGGGGGDSSTRSGSSWNSLRVVGGSYSQLSGTCIIGNMNGQGYSSDYNSFFAGTNASLVVTNMYVGNYGACNEAVFDGVTNGMTMGKLYLGAESGASNNVFRASNVHSMSIDDLRVGWRGNSNFLEMSDVTNLTIDTLRVGLDSWSNRAEIVGRDALSIAHINMGGYASGDNYALIDAGTSGAALDFSILSHGTGFGNEIELRNFTANCAVNGFYWGAGVTNATLRVGPGCVFNTTAGGGKDLRLSFEGPGCRLVVDGADWTHGTNGDANDGYMNVGHYKTDNHLEVINGGKLIIKASTLGFGTMDDSSITVGDRAEMEMYRIREYGSNNRITISNGTIRITKECSLPATNDDTTITTNNVVEFLGDAPRMIGYGCALNFSSRDVDGKSLVKNSYIHFVVPKDGYSETTPPLETTDGKNIVIQSGNFITLGDSKFTRLGGKTLLMRASGTISVSNLAELGSKLPEHAVLTLSADNKELWLRMPYRRALCIIFR